MRTLILVALGALLSISGQAVPDTGTTYSVVMVNSNGVIVAPTNLAAANGLGAGGGGLPVVLDANPYATNSLGLTPNGSLHVSFIYPELWVSEYRSSLLGGATNWIYFQRDTAGPSFYRYTGAVGFRMWDQGNDGTGSDMDADKVDGQHAADFVPQAVFTDLSNRVGRIELWPTNNWALYGVTNVLLTNAPAGESRVEGHTLVLGTNAGTSVSETYPVFLLTLGDNWTDFEIKASTNNFGRSLFRRYVMTIVTAAGSGTYQMTTNIIDGHYVFENVDDPAYGLLHYGGAWGVFWNWRYGDPAWVLQDMSAYSGTFPPSTWLGGEGNTIEVEPAGDPGMVYYYSSWTAALPGYEDSDPMSYFTEDSFGDVRAWRRQLLGVPISGQITSDSVIPEVCFIPSTNFAKFGAWMDKTNTHLVWSYTVVDTLGFKTNPVSGAQTWSLVRPQSWESRRVTP